MADSQFQLDLARFGPEGTERLDSEASRAWCRQLALGHYENFSVLSRLVPVELRDDFAAVYAFCRVADDLGDEIGDPQRSLELLAWFREQLAEACDGEPTHPALVALKPVMARHQLSRRHFEDLLSAFEQDQVKTRYDSWDELVGYCRLSAAPVGRLVLELLGESRDEAMIDLSDQVCIALQLTNHWQDVRRDVLERDRIYIPREEYVASSDFARRLAATAQQGWGVDHTFLEESRRIIERCVNRTWSMYEKGQALLPRLGRRGRPLVELLMSGGVAVLRRVEEWNYETALHRPRLGAPTKGVLLLKAWWTQRRMKNSAVDPAKGVSSSQ